MRLLSHEELDAVIAHESHHARRRDPLRLLVARSVAADLFFLPVMRRLAERYAAMAELAADEAAVGATRGPRALASALLAFDAHPSPAVVGIAPERIDHLLGRDVRWDLPTLTLLAGIGRDRRAAGADPRHGGHRRRGDCRAPRPDGAELHGRRSTGAWSRGSSGRPAAAAAIIARDRLPGSRMFGERVREDSQSRSRAPRAAVVRAGLRGVHRVRRSRSRWLPP